MAPSGSSSLPLLTVNVAAGPHETYDLAQLGLLFRISRAVSECAFQMLSSVGMTAFSCLSSSWNTIAEHNSSPESGHCFSVKNIPCITPHRIMGKTDHPGCYFH